MVAPLEADTDPSKVSAVAVTIGAVRLEPDTVVAFTLTVWLDVNWDDDTVLAARLTP